MRNGQQNLDNDEQNQKSLFHKCYIPTNSKLESKLNESGTLL